MYRPCKGHMSGINAGKNVDGIPCRDHRPHKKKQIEAASECSPDAVDALQMLSSMQIAGCKIKPCVRNTEDHLAPSKGRLAVCATQMNNAQTENR